MRARGLLEEVDAAEQNVVPVRPLSCDATEIVDANWSDYSPPKLGGDALAQRGLGRCGA